MLFNCLANWPFFKLKNSKHQSCRLGHYELPQKILERKQPVDSIFVSIEGDLQPEASKEVDKFLDKQDHLFIYSIL